MSKHLKKDHSIGAGTAAVGGAIAGAAIGSLGGPIGTVIGAVAGAVGVAKAGDALSEAVNPSEYQEYFEGRYRNAEYYSTGRNWDDYEPAYRYGYGTYGQYRGQRFEDIEPTLERDWDRAKAESRLTWSEARGAVRDGWYHIERAIPGDAEGNGR